MDPIKYIYFEKYFISGKEDSTTPITRNENILLLKPNTNSEGIWLFTNVTERSRRKGSNEDSYAVVEQYWIDFEKYNDENQRDKNTIELIKQVKSKLTRLYNRETIIERLKED